MNKRMRLLLSKTLVIMGTATLSLAPVYAGNVVTDSLSAEVSEEREEQAVQNSEVSSDVKEYELIPIRWDNYYITVNIKLNGNELISISNKGQVLERGRDYKTESYQAGEETVKISSDYMGAQDVGDLVLNFEFSGGETQELIIKILPFETVPKLTNLTGTYDPSKEKNWVATDVIFNHNKLVCIYLKDKEGKYERELVCETDYKVGRTMNNSMEVWFCESFLQSLPVGRNEVVFHLDADPISFYIDVLWAPATLSETERNYDKIDDKNKQIGPRLTLNDNQLTSIKCNGEELIEKKDYRRTCPLTSGYVFEFQNAFLQGLPEGKNDIIFNFDQGESLTYTLNVTRRARDSAVSAPVTEYELNSGEYILNDGLQVDMDYNYNDLVGIYNGDEQLIAGEDYNEVPKHDAITIDYDYLNRQQVGDVNLTFVFTTGTPQKLKLTMLPMQTTAELEKTELISDRNMGGSVDSLWVYKHHNKLLGITCDGEELEINKDYYMGEAKAAYVIALTDKFLEKLPLGKTEVFFNFDNTEPLKLILNVIDTGKGTSTLKVGLDKSTEVNSNKISNSFKLAVDGEENYDLSKLEVRYYYTADGEAEQSVAVDNAAMNYTEAPWYEGITDNVQAKIVKMETPTATADTYLEISFGGDVALSNKAAMTVDTRINKLDWSNYDQSNDFSYDDASKVAVFYDGELISGSMPN